MYAHAFKCAVHNLPVLHLRKALHYIQPGSKWILVLHVAPMNYQVVRNDIMPAYLDQEVHHEMRHIDIQLIEFLQLVNRLLEARSRLPFTMCIKLRQFGG